MIIGSTLKHALGIIAGILIPGANEHTTDLTHSIQQEIAEVYGAAAAKLAAELKLDTTGMSGPDKVFAITKALVATAERDGSKGDLKILSDVVLDVVQAAYRAIGPNIGSEIIALASALTANSLVAVAAELVAPVVQAEVDSRLAYLREAATDSPPSRAAIRIVGERGHAAGDERLPVRAVRLEHL